MHKNIVSLKIVLRINGTIKERSYKGFCICQVPDDHGEVDDNSEKTPSKASKSPQKSTRRPKTVPVKVSLLDGLDYDTAVEVCLYIFIHDVQNLQLA